MARRSRVVLQWGWSLAAWTLLVLAGCGDAVTVHPVVDAQVASTDIPPVGGKWVVREGAGDPEVLTYEGAIDDRAPCRPGHARYRENDEDTEIGDDVCFADINGYLIAEVKTPQPYVFYRQFLVRITDEAIETCGGVPVWVMLKSLAEDQATGYSLDTLDYTVRKGRGEEADLIVITSPSKKLREFLELALPELASACDNEVAEGYTWVRFERMTPEEAAADAEGNE